MSVDIARLQLEVDSTQVRNASGGLKNLETQGKRTEAQISNLSKSASLMGASVKATTGMLKQMSVVAAGLALGLGIAVKHSLDVVAEIDRLATMAGVSAEAFQELEYAAGQYQITQDALTDGLKELSLRGDEFVVTGAGSAKESFERLGYSVKDVNELLKDTPAFLSDIISRMEGLDTASQIRIADELFGGQGGEQFVKMIQGGADAFDDMRKAAHDLGVVIDDDMVKQSADAKKKVEELTSVISAQFNTAVAEIAPDIITLTANMLDWIKANKTLIGQGISGVAREIGSGFEFVSRAVTKTVDAFEKLIEIYNKFPDSLLTRILKSQTAGLDETRDFLKSMGLVDATVTKVINKDTPEYEHYASGFADKPSSGRSESTLVNKKAAEKLASQQAAAWQSAYSSMDTLTQATYDKMLTYYAQDYEANLKLLGDKETAQALYTQRVKALNEKLLGADKSHVQDRAALYQQSFSYLDTITRATYDAMLQKYNKDYDDFVRRTGDKETAMAVYTQKVQDLNEKMYGEDYSEEILRQIAALEEEAVSYGMTAKEIDAYKRQKMGATDATIKNAQAIYANIKAKKAEAAAEAEDTRLKAEAARVTDYARTKAEEFGDEIKKLDVLLQKGYITPETYTKASEKMISAIDFPDASNIDNSDDLDQWYDEQIAKLEEYRQARSDLNATWDEQEKQLTQQHQDKLSEIEQARYQLAISSASSLFGSMADMAKVFAGEQSETYRAMFAVSKAFAIAEASIKLWQAIANAGASVPWPGNIAAMASVAAAMGGLVSNIAAVGMAHDGIDRVPQSGTWLLEKGERVTTAATSDKLDSVLSSIQQGGGTAKPMNVNVYEAVGTSAQVTQSDDGQSIDVIISQVEQAVVKRMDRGTGVATYFDRRYGRRW
jgi:hypothetical protein